MAKGIAPEILQDRKKALLVAVNGTYGGGKKIFPDAMRRTLMASTSLAGFKGRKEYDEFWFYELGGKPVEIDFVNTAWDRSDFSKMFRNEKMNRNCYNDAKLMMRLRKFGGVTFVHNDMDFALQRAGLDIFISRPMDIGLFKVPESMKTDFQSASFNNQWGRFVRVIVRDHRLKASAQFQEAMRDICEGGYKKPGKYDFDADDRHDFGEVKVKALGMLGMKTAAFKRMGG